MCHFALQLKSTVQYSSNLIEHVERPLHDQRWPEEVDHGHVSLFRVLGILLMGVPACSFQFRFCQATFSALKQISYHWHFMPNLQSLSGTAGVVRVGEHVIRDRLAVDLGRLLYDLGRLLGPVGGDQPPVVSMSTIS